MLVVCLLKIFSVIVKCEDGEQDENDEHGSPRIYMSLCDTCIAETEKIDVQCYHGTEA
jgi:hypothetical protein